MSDDKGMDLTLRQMGNENGRPILSKAKAGKEEFSRQQIINAFHNAFQMIGGTTRLALWGNENPTEFFKLYAKLLPATSLQIGDNSRVTIIHAIPPTALDQHEGYDQSVVVDVSDQT